MKKLIILFAVLVSSNVFSQNIIYIIDRTERNLFSNLNTFSRLNDFQILPTPRINTFREVTINTMLPSRDLYPVTNMRNDYSLSPVMIPSFDRHNVNVLISNYNINVVTPLSFPVLPTLPTYFQTIPTNRTIYLWER